MLKPLDLQTIMPRSLDLGRYEQVQVARPSVEQMETTREVMKQATLRQEQIQANQAAADTNRIRDDKPEEDKNRERRYRRYNQSKKQVPDEPDVLTDIPDTERRHHFDMKM